MSCFLVVGVEAVVASAVRAKVKKVEAEKGIVDEQGNQVADVSKHGYSWTRKLGWLTKMLWGGLLILVVDHVMSGELVPWPPFLTAMSDPTSTAHMLYEISTVGVAMAVVATVVWFVATFVADGRVKRSALAKKEGDIA